MNNNLSQLAQSNPENVVSAPVGSIFHRTGDQFYVTTNGVTTKLNLSKKGIALNYRDQIWYPTLKDDKITFANKAETWIKKGGQAGNTGWKFSDNNVYEARTVEANIRGIVVSASAGEYFTLYLTSNNELWGSGENYDGQLGLGYTSNEETSSLIASNVSKIAAGDYHSLFIDITGSLFGMGYNGYGQLGQNDTSRRESPVKIFDDVIAAAAGYAHTVFIESDGTLWSCGGNYTGQLGDGTSNQREEPVQVLSGSNVVAVACGYEHTIFLKANGEMWGMGDGDSGQLGNENYDDEYSPILIDTDVTSISAGAYHTAYLKTGSVYAMGANWDGQLGFGSDESYISVPTLVATSVSKVFSGYNNTYIIKTDGTMWGTGNNNDGQLGFESEESGEEHSFVNMNKPNVDLVTGGEGHVVYVQKNRSVYGMGYNGNLEIGYFDQKHAMVSTNGINWTLDDGSVGYENYWYGVAYGNGKFVAVGEGSSTMNSTNGTVWNIVNHSGSNNYYSDITYGNNIFMAVGDTPSEGQIMTSTDGETWTHQTSSANNTLYGVAYGSGSFVAVGDNGGLISSTDNGVTWESHTSSIFNDWVSVAYGNGKFVAVSQYPSQDNWRNTFEKIFPVSGSVGSASLVSAGEDQTMFIRNDGVLFVMGHNGNAELGLGDFEDRYYPTQVTTSVVHAAAGYQANYYVDSDNKLWGSGYNDAYRLGNSIPVYAYATRSVLIDTNVETISHNGSYHLLYIKTDKTLWGVGANWDGQLGIGSFENVTSSIQIDTNVVSASCGQNYNAYIKSNGDLYTMGVNNWGQLGTEDYVRYNTPQNVASNVKEVDFGDSFMVYLKNDGTVWGVGYNNLGCYGTGNNNSSEVARQVATGALHIDVGGYSTFYIANDNSLWTTGDNDYGQLGDGTYAGRNTFIKVEEDVVEVSIANTYGNSTFIRKSDGSLWGTGYNGYGQLGDGRLLDMVTVSEDGGNTWTDVGTTQYPWTSITFGNGRFVAVGDNGYVMYSTDGYNWNNGDRPSHHDWESVTYGNGKFVAVGDYPPFGKQVMYSTTGHTWTEVETTINSYLSSVTYGDGKFVAVSYDSSNTISPEREIILK